MVDDLERFEALQEEYSPKQEDYLASINIIDEFFSNYLIKGILNRSWNIGIRIARKGSQLYLDQQLSKKELNLLHVFSDEVLETNLDIIEGKSVLIFDDSIKDGNHVDEVLKKILPSTSDVSVAVLLSREDTLMKLKSKFPEVKFYSQMTASKETFSKLYLKRIQPYLDSICIPLQHEHPLLSIDFDSSFNEQTIMGIFEKYGSIKADECKKFEYIDGDKRLFEFKKEIFNDLAIIRNSKEFGILEKDLILEDAVKIRIYIRKGLVRRLIIQPIILEGYILPGQNNDQLITAIDKFVKNKIIYQFLISLFLPNLIDANMGIRRLTVVFD